MSHKPYLEWAGANNFALFFKYPAFPMTIRSLLDLTTHLPQERASIYKITWIDYNHKHSTGRMNTKAYRVIHDHGHELASPRKIMQINFDGYLANGPLINNVSIQFPSGTFAIGCYKERLFVSLSVPKVTWIYDVATGTKSSVEIPHPDDHVKFDFFIDVMGDLLGVMQSDVPKATWLHLGDHRYSQKILYDYVVYRLEHTDDFNCCRWSKLNVTGNRVFSWE
jgi:hypothetical protein